MKTYIWIFFTLVFIISCKVHNTYSNIEALSINDSLIHIVKIDSTNYTILNKSFEEKFKLYECNLDKAKLLEIENDIYMFLLRDTNLVDSWIIKQFENSHRQYIILADNFDKYLYVLYTYYKPDDEQSISFFKRKQFIWYSYFSKFITSDRIFQFELSYPLSSNNKIQYFDLTRLRPTPEKDRK